ncbi:hypothetical protein JXA56_03310, partial [Candidatus Micrarchaeota archaeon]|nr:hypothetical protein [Candidatus Micrarchaeota archaeon]
MRKKLIIDPNRLFIDKPLGRYDPNNDWFEKQRAKKPEPEPAPKPGNRQQETGGRQQETGGSMIIVPLNKKLPYLEAFRLVSEMKKQLPSHALHDDYLVMTEQWEQIKDIYPAWAREIIA